MAKGISQSDMAANYGWALSVLKSDKYLWKLFNTAVKKSYSVNRFVAELRNTPWFKKHGESYRQAEVLQKTDPATFKVRSNQVTQRVADMAGAMGSNLSAAQLKLVSHNAMYLGWDDGTLKQALTNYVTQVGNTGHYGGDAGKAEDELRAYALDMGQNISDSSLKTWVQSIASGNADVSHYTAYLQQNAQNAFPQLADKIKQGITVKTLADPYMQQMAQTLEMNPQQITLQDPTIKKALQSVGPDGKPAMQTMWQFSNDLKKDRRWLSTNDAENTLMSAGHQVLKDMGFKS